MCTFFSTQEHFYNICNWTATGLSCSYFSKIVREKGNVIITACIVVNFQYDMR